jgi:hypothetical protein
LLKQSLLGDLMDGFVWVQPPSNIIKGIEDYGAKVEAALYAVAGKWGQEVQDACRVNASWEDRSGNARGGIFYAVDGFGHGEMVGDVSAAAKSLMKETSIEAGSEHVLIIVVSHTVFYGKYLELDHGGRYAIIMSQIEANLPRLEANVQAVFRG